MRSPSRSRAPGERRPRRRSSPRSGPLVSLVLAAVLAACAPGPPAASAEVPDGLGPPVADPVVLVDDNSFTPGGLVVDVGTEVRWEWRGRVVHDVVGEGFDSGIQLEGGFVHTFEEPGTYPYVCTLHPGMEGTVYVLPTG